MTGHPTPLPQSTSAPRAEDRRRAGRYHFPRTRTPLIPFVVRPSFANYKAFLADISPDGLALSVGQGLAVGSVVAVRLGGGAADLSRVVSALVVYARPVAGGWLLGCRLATPLSDGELGAFGADL